MVTSRYQPAIIAPAPTHARFMEFRRIPGTDTGASLATLVEAFDSNDVVGFGPALFPGVSPFEALQGPEVSVPATQHDLWCWVRGDDPGVILHRARRIEEGLRPAFQRLHGVDGFKYGVDRDLGMDLTGYEDGTENPTDDDALAAAISAGDAPHAPAGGSFVAVQKWVHDLGGFESLDAGERDHIIGRRRSDNQELEDAPESAHVKRTAQESFSPEAFLLRRSMPWADQTGEGLVFVAFGHDLDAFKAQLRRMVGLEDGITDALFRFSRPVTGAFYWCPPLADGRLDLSFLGP